MIVSSATLYRLRGRSSQATLSLFRCASEVSTGGGRRRLSLAISSTSTPRAVRPTQKTNYPPADLFFYGIRNRAEHGGNPRTSFAFGFPPSRHFSRVPSPEEESLPEELVSVPEYNVGGAPATVQTDVNAEDDETTDASLGLFSTSGGTSRVRPPSPLESLAEGYTPGQALHLLQKKGAGKRPIRITEMDDLCRAARPSHPKDAKVIRTALKDFKRTSHFVLRQDGAREAMEGMMRSMLPGTDNEEDVEAKKEELNKVNAALWVCKAFLEESTGLYYASEVENVDTVLGVLLEGVREEGLRIVPRGNGGDKSEQQEGGGGQTASDSTIDSETVDDSRARMVMEVVGDVIELLVRRGSHPDSSMKKRAQRKYRKLIKVVRGPNPATIHVAAQICLAIGGSDVAQQKVVDPVANAQWPRYQGYEDTVALIRDVREREQAALVLEARKSEEEAQKEAGEAKAEGAEKEV